MTAIGAAWNDRPSPVGLFCPQVDDSVGRQDILFCTRRRSDAMAFPNLGIVAWVQHLSNRLLNVGGICLIRINYQGIYPMSLAATNAASTGAPAKKKYVRAVGPKLRKLLYLIFVLFALMFANSSYLGVVTLMEWVRDEAYQDYYYQFMFLAHLVLGIVLILPVIVFGLIHMRNSKDRRNRRAVRIGYVLFAVSLVLLVTGVLLVRVTGFDLKQPTVRNVVYWLHVIAPFALVWLYWLHRIAGPRIKWKIGLRFLGVTSVAVVAIVFLQMQDPRDWNAVGPESGVQYFEPSLARTTSGKFIPADALMNDEYCLKCHEDIHKDWSDSVHRFSSFNNRALPGKRQSDPRGLVATRWERSSIPLVCGLPRSGAVFLGRLR